MPRVLKGTLRGLKGGRRSPDKQHIQVFPAKWRPQVAAEEVWISVLLVFC